MRRAAAVLAGGLVVAATVPALAAAPTGCQPSGMRDAITGPGEVVTVTTADRPVTATADLAPSLCDRVLQVGPPGAAPYALSRARHEAGPLSAVLSTADAPRANGTYVVQLSEDGSLAADPLTRTVRLEVPPAAPADLAARLDGRRVLLTWRPGGAEPDLLGYRVTDTGGAPAPVDPAAACHDGTCAVALAYGDEVSGRRTYAVTAVRACPTCAARELTAEAGAAADVPAVPVAPAAAPQQGAASPPSGTPAVATPLTPEQLQKALQVPRTSTALPAPAPQVALPDGTFSPTLDYSAAAPTAQDREPAGPGPLRRVADVLEAPQLARTVAGALLLLLAGAHLRRWARSTPTA